MDLNSSSIGRARLDSGVAPPLGVVKEEVAILIVLVRRHRRAVGAAVRRAVDDEVPGAVEEEAGPAVYFSIARGGFDLGFKAAGFVAGRTRAFGVCMPDYLNLCFVKNHVKSIATNAQMRASVQQPHVSALWLPGVGMVLSPKKYLLLRGRR